MQASSTELTALQHHPADGAGWRVVAAALAAAREVFGPRLITAYALGSLAHGGFAPSVSDVDLALILDSADPKPDEDCARIRARVAADHPSALGQRLSLFWSSWRDLEGRLPSGRLPLLDRLDLVHWGRCVFGEDRRASIWVPDAVTQHERLVTDAARFMLDRWALPAYTAQLRDPGSACADLRTVTKLALMPVRFVYTLETSRFGNLEPAVAHWLAKGSRDTARLARAAWLWRAAGGIPNRDVALGLLQRALRPLYGEAIESYAKATLGLGRLDLALALAAWGQTLGVIDEGLSRPAPAEDLRQS